MTSCCVDKDRCLWSKEINCKIFDQAPTSMQSAVNLLCKARGTFADRRLVSDLCTDDRLRATVSHQCSDLPVKTLNIRCARSARGQRGFRVWADYSLEELHSSHSWQLSRMHMQGFHSTASSWRCTHQGYIQAVGIMTTLRRPCFHSGCMAGTAPSCEYPSRTMFENFPR